MAADFPTSNIRNIVLAGHSGAGKTMLAEAMLYAAKETSRIGSIPEGTTVSDYHPDEVERKISLTLSMLNATWNGNRLNILDTPGYLDFVGDVKSAVRVSDIMILCADTSSGVGFGADSAWDFADGANIPVIFALTKVETEQAHFDETLEYLREHFSHDIVPLEYPVYQNKQLVATVDILGMKSMQFAPDGSGTHQDSADVPSDVKSRCSELRNELMEVLAESDEDLLNAYFENGTLSDEQITKGLRLAFKSRRIYPLFCSASARNIGVTPMMDFIVENGPGPADMPPPHAVAGNGADAVVLPGDSEPVAFIFKTVSEPHVGELSFFRVYSGRISPGMEMINTGNGTVERINQIFSLNGKIRKEAPVLHAGDMGALVKLKSTHTNDTLTSKTRQVAIEKINFPAPIADAAVSLKGKGDEAKISEGLHLMHSEDPTFLVHTDSDTHQTVVSGLGELHLEVIIKRLCSKYNIEVEMKPPRVPFREAIKGTVVSSYRHKKQTGGAGQFGEVHFYMEPYQEGKPVPNNYQVRGEELEQLPWGGAFHFVNSIIGGSIDARFIPAVKKGIMEMLQRGVYAGYPITNVRVVLFDGKMHAVDSNENAFKTAARMCFKQCFRECRPSLMEPIWNIEITAPSDYMGDIMGDLSSHRGRIGGMDAKGALQIIKAQVPLSELYGYAARLRSLTQGRGNFSRYFSHYEETPKDVEAKIVAGADLQEVEE